MEAARAASTAAGIDEVIELALGSGLIEEADIVDGDLTVSSSARRNSNVRFTRTSGRGYLIKRADLGSGAAETLANEVGFYRHCADGVPEVAALMPPFVAAMEADRVLVLELVAESRSLWLEYQAHGPPEIPLAPALELGRALGILHSTFAAAEVSAAGRPRAMREEPPDFFDFHRPHPGILRSASPARLALCRCLQEEPAIGEGLAAARAAWRAETVIHGDVRSDNLLVIDRGAEAPRVTLIDWEFAQWGDPAWDLAGAFEDHVRFWLANMSQRPDLEPAARLATARWPLTAVQAAVRGLCAGYSEALGATPASLAPRLERAVAYSAARLILTAWENCRYLERMSSLAVLLVQLAGNILSDPKRTAEGLYGLAEVGEHAAPALA